ncbi:hypothetical protein F0L68_31380 [Solihabitans fulvus]|uniref:Uncharacterized protein n=1 Tax=Solihabitans fulvus TaxID=1892852 RepID=A0A5B2WUL1_9PSEU|nr:hypothetical protein [Solihabitans fulvus]KAA2254109.1 hypothetical protein F0L68_31380 [Solihabitans fulvus]
MVGEQFLNCGKQFGRQQPEPAPIELHLARDTGGVREEPVQQLLLAVVEACRAHRDLGHVLQRVLAVGVVPVRVVRAGLRDGGAGALS